MIRSNRDPIFISQNNTDEMRLTKSQLEVLHILWASDTPLSAQGIAEKLKYRIGSSLIVSIAIENLLAEDAIYWAGSFHSYSNKRENVLILYAAKIRFDEYYAVRLKNITPRNLFHLIEKMLQSDKFSPKQLQGLSSLLDEKIKPFEC